MQISFSVNLGKKLINDINVVSKNLIELAVIGKKMSNR